LNLANNELTEVVPEAIEGLKCLVELDLSKNELDFVPSGLKALGPTLEVLKLDDNPIIELNEESFSGTCPRYFSFRYFILVLPKVIL
jgi:Leucine-rich repeat (LRR) protein